MRLNKWIAAHSMHSRRKADALISSGAVTVNGKTAVVTTQAEETDIVEINGKRIGTQLNKNNHITVLLHKPTGYVCSRNGQGSPTVYGLLPLQYHHLDIAGRLDKDSSGLVILTNNGQLMQELTHPSFKKDKVYTVTLNSALRSEDQAAIQNGVQLDDGMSALELELLSADKKQWQVTMHEGRNRQIRRTFAALDYAVTKLIRLQIGAYSLGKLPEKSFEKV